MHRFKHHMTEEMLIHCISEVEMQNEVLICHEKYVAAHELYINRNSLPALNEQGNKVTWGALREMEDIALYWLKRRDLARRWLQSYEAGRKWLESHGLYDSIFWS